MKVYESYGAIYEGILLSLFSLLVSPSLSPLSSLSLSLSLLLSSHALRFLSVSLLPFDPLPLFSISLLSSPFSCPFSSLPPPLLLTSFSLLPFPIFLSSSRTS